MNNQSTFFPEATALNEKRKINSLEDTQELIAELKAKNLFEGIFLK